MKLKLTDVVEVNEQPGVYHIPGSPMSGAASLCGWVDVPHVTHDVGGHEVNCGMCLDIIIYCKKITK